MLVLQNAPTGDLQIPGLTFSPVDWPSTTAKFDLTLSLIETPDGLAGALEYATDLFDRATMERFVGHFANLLVHAAENPEQSLAELRLMGEAEEQLLQVDLNRAEQIYALPTIVPDLFAQQVERTPEKLAVVGVREALTYRELAERSTALARQLQKAGVRIDQRVGLLADPEPSVLLGMLGILQSGGGFVPLDPRSPDERLAWLLEDCDCQVLVTQRRHLERVSAIAPSLQILCLEEIKGSGEAPEPHREPRSLAYIVYTSGSTGRPKGVPISHENLVPMLRWGCDYLGLGEHSRVLQSLSYFFDFGIFEQLTTMLAGGTLFFPGEAAGDPAAFAREIVRRGINTLHTTPAFARELAACDLSLDSLEIVHLGGEALARSTVARIQEAAPHATVYNGYGPTEATVNSAIYEIGPLTENSWPVMPIGRRSADNALYILDSAGRLVPFSVRGELLVGGIGVARGYLNRPDLTAERFVPDPFGSEPGGRLYRTGDLVRYLPSGDIEFLGRIDQQVKVRGFRIEPGEIEAALREHPAVRETVVIARPEPSGNLRLIAYVVASGMDSAELRAFLAQRLPAHMVPSAFVALAALPLTPNGKLDRKALPEPEQAEAAEPQAGTAPRTPEEEMLAGLWAQLLGLSSVGVDDNFFALGGHSLLAARLVARIREALEIDLPLRALFEAPTVAGLAARLATARRAEAIPPLVPRERSGEVPLSFAQERLWIVDQLSPGNAAYNMPLAVRLDGRLDAAVLAQSFAKIVRRHETLRTTFQTVAGRPVQVIAPEAGFVLPRIDLVGLPEEKRAAEAQRLLAVEAVRPFDLAQGPILRVLLLRLSEQEHLCLVNMHHIASDGWSLGVLVREVGALYTSFAEGLASPLPPLPVQYADFTLWQREWLQGEVLERQIEFWRNTLAGAPTRLDLPTDRPRPAVASLAGAAVPVALSADLTASLSALAQRRGATLFMTLLAAFDALLHRITSQEDLLVGSPVANRGVTQIEGLIGFFVNTLVLRARPTADQPFTALLSEVRSAALAAYAHQDLPFERLVDELAVGRSLDRNPLFQTLLAVQNAPVEALDLPGLTLSPVEAETATAKFDLSLALGTSAQGLAGAIEYATDLFDAATVHRFAGWFARLLAGAVADPEQPLRELPLLTPSELQQTLTAWNDTATAYPREATIHALFAEQAALRPTSVALVGDSAELSYKDLDVAANRLAHHLRALGVGPEVLTAVCLERSLEAVITLLAVLKAGGAFVPLDPTYPADRLAFMLADTAAPVLVTEERLLSRLPIPEGLRVVCLDREDEAIAQRAANDPGVEVSPDGLAYVMYTSGSTGRPKGVAVSHRNVVRLVRETHFADLSASQVFLQLAPLSFDASTLEIWGPLANGGRLAVLPAGQPTLAELGAAIERFGVTTLWLTAGLFHQMAEAEPQSLRRLSQLLAGGDVLQAQAIRRLLAEPGGPVLINGYGPTEGTTFTCCHPMTDPQQIPNSVPIGRPIANTRIFLLDRSATPVPVGVPGELYAAGDGLARGYLNRPELTAEKFVPAPTVCGEAPGARLYRTGDLARFLPDGTVEFMGRIDQQVKIRGFRIEPEEIQAVLSRHPQVREALVIVRAEGDDKRLIGYLIPAGDEVPTSAELRDFLRDQLPEYMIPSAFVALQAWPLTPNSKIDRAALPAPERTGAADRIAPRDVLEHELARLWEDVLGVGPIGIRDDFFALGGHSLLAVRLMAQVEEQLGRSLPLTALFTAGTVEGMAALLREESAPESASNIIPLQPRGTRPPFFWVHPAGGDVLCYAMLSRYLGDDQPLYGIQARGFARDEERPNSLEEMAALYIDEIRLRQPEGPYFLGGWSLGGPVAFEMARQLRALGETVGLLAILDGAPFLETARPEESDVDYLLDIAAYVGNFWGRAPEVSPERLATLDPDGQIAYVAEGLAAVDFLPPGTGERQLRRVLAVYRANVTALRAYQAGFYPDGLTLLRAEERPDAPGLLSRDDLGWRDLTGGPVEILTVPGNHLSLLAEPNVHVLAAHLRACLERAQTTASVPLLQSP
jgi:amino acid adenylation domain-containing protein